MIYFDHAATSYPKERRVIRALCRGMQLAGGNPGRSAHSLSLRASEEIFEARCVLARMFDTEEQLVIFTPGATAAINMALLGLTGGKRIFLSDQEHNAVYRTAYRLQLEQGCELIPFHADTYRELDEQLAEGDTVVAAHASNVTGDVLPAERIGALCRARGATFILDAAQTAGHLLLRLPLLQADALCIPGHKALGGIQGVGALLLRQPLSLPPPFTGGGGNALSPTAPEELPERLEAGTPPTPAIIALKRAASALTDAKIVKRQWHLDRLCQLAQNGLSALDGIRILGNGDYRCGILSFTAKQLPSEAVAHRLAAQGICVRGGYHCAPLAHGALGTLEGGCVRLSFGDTNTPREVRHFLKVLGRILREK